MDYFLIIGTTNTLDIVDPELLIPDRFDSAIKIPNTYCAGLYVIFKIHTKDNTLKTISI